MDIGCRDLIFWIEGFGFRIWGLRFKILGCARRLVAGGVGGKHILRRHISRAQPTKNRCVGLFFQPPAYAGLRRHLPNFSPVGFGLTP